MCNKNDFESLQNFRKQFSVQKQVCDVSGRALYWFRLLYAILPSKFVKAERNTILKQAWSFYRGVCHSFADIEGLNSGVNFLICFFVRVSWSDPCCGFSVVLLASFFNCVACSLKESSTCLRNEGDSYLICTVLSVFQRHFKLVFFISALSLS